MTTSSLASLLGVSGSSGLPIGAYAQFPAGAPTLIQQSGSEYVLNGAVVDYAAKYSDAVAKAPWIGNDKLPVSAFGTASNPFLVKSGSYAIGFASGGVRRSTDMLNWATVTVANIGSSPYSLCASGSYVCVGDNATSIRYSADNGATWSAIPSTVISAAPAFILRANGIWAAFTNTLNGTQSEYATQSNANPGASAWTLRSPGVSYLTNLATAAASSGLFVVGGSNSSDSSSRIYSSANAVDWTVRYTGTGSIIKLIYTGSKFFAVTSGGDLLSSASGTGAWVSDASKPVSSGILDAFTDGAGAVILLTNESGTYGLRVSIDHGATWTAQKTLTGMSLQSSAKVSLLPGFGFALVCSAGATYLVDYSAIGQTRWVGTTAASTAAPGVSYVRIL